MPPWPSRREPSVKAQPNETLGLRTNRLRIAFICGLAQWALLIAIQIGNFYGWLLPQIDQGWDAVSYLFTVILFIQSQNALMAAIFGLLAYFASASRIASRGCSLLSPAILSPPAS